MSYFLLLLEYIFILFPPLRGRKWLQQCEGAEGRDQERVWRERSSGGAGEEAEDSEHRKWTGSEPYEGATRPDQAGAAGERSPVRWVTQHQLISAATWGSPFFIQIQIRLGCFLGFSIDLYRPDISHLLSVSLWIGCFQSNYSINCPLRVNQCCVIWQQLYYYYWLCWIKHRWVNLTKELSCFTAKLRGKKYMLYA